MQSAAGFGYKSSKFDGPVEPGGTEEVNGILIETSIADIPEVVAQVRCGFRSFKTLDVSFRRAQLENLVTMVKENEQMILDVLYKDLHKNEIEGILSEISIVESDLVLLLNELDDLTSPQPYPRDLLNKFNDLFIQAEPYGVVLIVAPWNYPFHLVMLPLIGAIAAGNCCVVKPSEGSIATSNLFSELLPRYLDPDCYAVVTGGVDCSKALLQEKYDYIFYTGSTNVGRLIMKQAAENITPVTLELGGKTPTLVAPDANVEVSARRIIWGKCMNSGQACIAPDYVLCTRGVRDRLVPAMKRTIVEFYGENPQQSSDYGRIINRTHFKRLVGLLKKTDGHVAVGGDYDEDTLYFSPTVVTDVDTDDALMKSEIFGPILAVVTVRGVDQAIRIVNEGEKPLAFYIFTENPAVFQDINKKTSAGGVCHNDTLMHYNVKSFPFGGVGHSGMGAYHGTESFKTFSHYKPVYSTGTGLEALNKLRYPPYNMTKLSRLRWLLGVRRRSRLCVPWALLSLFLLVALVAILINIERLPEWLDGVDPEFGPSH